MLLTSGSIYLSAAGSNYLSAIGQILTRFEQVADRRRRSRSQAGIRQGLIERQGWSIRKVG